MYNSTRSERKANGLDNPGAALLTSYRVGPEMVMGSANGVEDVRSSPVKAMTSTLKNKKQKKPIPKKRKEKKARP